MCVCVCVCVCVRVHRVETFLVIWFVLERKICISRQFVKKIVLLDVVSVSERKSKGRGKER